MQRHCAFCLDLVAATKLRLCAGCQLRAYCSETCERRDWTAVAMADKGGRVAGQGHVRWCSAGAVAGEEDVDWTVTFIEASKGLGIVALRHFTRGERVMVDSCQRNLLHPGFLQLAPVGGTSKEKWERNAVGCAAGASPAVALRLSRANHDCNPNAGRVHDTATDCIVLYATREIAAGDEICINYVPWNSVLWEEQVRPPSRRDHITQNWGFTCRDDCFCKSVECERVVCEAIALDARILQESALFEHGLSHRMLFLSLIQQILDITRDICTPASQADYLWNGFSVAIMDQSNRYMGMAFLQKLVIDTSSVFHASDPALTRYNELLKNPSLHENYGKYD
ncbi:hypothetical protein BC830DRAFT_1165566 [Chytriomyces sp. MP71]|nr:hypothetical protein BC830DRAFT_1165566 [Chytriomyces sp. MP71]